MAATNGPNLNLLYGWSNGENGWDIGMNANLALLDAIINLAATGIVNAPTGSETNGTRYIIGTSPTGTFAGRANQVAVRISSAWVYYTPKTGWRSRIGDASTGSFVFFNGTTWVAEPTGLADAPSDANKYARFSGAWSIVNEFVDAPSDTNNYGRKGGAWTIINEFTDASSDGNYYARRNAVWTSFQPFVDAPNDGQVYARKLQAWDVISGGDLTTRQQWTRPWRGVSLSLAAAPGTFTPIPGHISWDTEVIDTENGWDILQPKRITVPSGVTKVRLRAKITLTGTAVAGALHASFQKNTEDPAATGSTGPFAAFSVRQSATGFTGNNAFIESAVIPVVAGDYFVVRLNSQSLGTWVPTPDCFFEMEVVEAVGAIDDYPIDLSCNIYQSPAANEIVFKTVFARDVGFAANLLGSQAVAETAATALTIFSISKNSTVIGTLQFAAGMAVGTYNVSGVQSFVPGDVLKIVAPATPDTTLADISLTLTGTRSL